MRKFLMLRFLFFALVMAVVAISCKDDSPAPTSAVPSFQFAVDPDVFNKVQFTNFSQNAVSVSWNFGDGSAASTEENPVHTYATEGKYTVVLTATGADKAAKEKSLEVTITDPNIELKKLTGVTSKTWKLLRDVSTDIFPLQVGPNDADHADHANGAIWWAAGKGNADIAKRPCLFNDEYVFTLDGKKFQYKTNGDIYRDGDVWPKEGCIDTTDPDAFKNKDGADISAWGDGNHTFTYDVAAKKLSLVGTGAFVGLCKVGNAENIKTPQASVAYNVLKLVDDVVDTLVLETTYGSGATAGYWRFVLVHYDNPALEPAMPTVPPPPGSIDVVNFDFETGTPTWTTFGGGLVVTRLANPHSSGINTSGFVMQVDQPASVEGWAGLSTDLDGTIDFTNKQTFKVKVYSPAVGTIVKFKLEATGDPSNNKEIDATTTAANDWEELTYTFTTDDSNKWNRLVLFFDFQTVVKANASTYFFDSVILQ